VPTALTAWGVWWGGIGRWVEPPSWDWGVGSPPELASTELPCLSLLQGVLPDRSPSPPNPHNPNKKKQACQEPQEHKDEGNKHGPFTAHSFRSSTLGVREYCGRERERFQILTSMHQLTSQGHCATPVAPRSNPTEHRSVRISASPLTTQSASSGALSAGTMRSSQAHG
jgi:hypothetical protein